MLGSALLLSQPAEHGLPLTLWLSAVLFWLLVGCCWRAGGPGRLRAHEHDRRLAQRLRVTVVLCRSSPGSAAGCSLPCQASMPLQCAGCIPGRCQPDSAALTAAVYVRSFKGHILQAACAAGTCVRLGSGPGAQAVVFWAPAIRGVERGQCNVRWLAGLFMLNMFALQTVCHECPVYFHA
jgi:hypothetical protein